MIKLRRDPKVLAFVLLLAATAAWGSTFVIVKGATAHNSVVGFLAWRFLVAGGLLTVVRPRSLQRLGRRGWAQGVVLGLTLAGGYCLQTFGLRYTSAAISGFLTGLQVVFTPLLAWWLFRHRPAARALLATLLALGGLAVMSLHGLSFGLGALLTVAAALLFAGQIVGLGFWSSAQDHVRLGHGPAAHRGRLLLACHLAARAPSPGRPF